MRNSSQRINKSLKKQIEHSLNQLISDIKTPKESEFFLKSILTSSEYESLSKRLAVAYWLKKGRTYKNVKDNLKVSSATIANIQEASKKPGFQKALQKLEAGEWAALWAGRIKKIVNK